jgi:hypothetical protein
MPGTPPISPNGPLEATSSRAFHGNRHHTRHLLNQEFIQALLLHFREHGKKAIEKVAREQPASYLKILALLVPRQHKLEYSNSLKNWTDEELAVCGKT